MAPDICFGSKTRKIHSRPFMAKNQVRRGYISVAKEPLEGAEHCGGEKAGGKEGDEKVAAADESVPRRLAKARICGGLGSARTKVRAYLRDNSSKRQEQ